MPTYDNPMPHPNHMPTSTSDPITRRKFTRYLRSLKYDLLNSQEVRTEDNNVIESLNMELQAKDSIWTQHVGIVSFNPNIRISPIFIMLNKHAVFKTFYIDIIELPLLKDETDVAHFTKYSNFLITGDFNYHHYTTYRSSNSQCPHPIRSWKQTLNQHLYDCINSDDITETYSVANPHITFSRGNSRTTTDYIFASLAIKASMTKSGVDFINPDWTDHALISIDLVLVSKKHGKGIYRANPALAKNKRFVEQLSTLLQELKPDTANSPHNSPQLEWDSMKRKVRQFCERFCRIWTSKEEVQEIINDVQDADVEMSEVDSMEEGTPEPEAEEEEVKSTGTVHPPAPTVTMAKKAVNIFSTPRKAVKTPETMMSLTDRILKYRVTRDAYRSRMMALMDVEPATSIIENEINEYQRKLDLMIKRIESLEASMSPKSEDKLDYRNDLVKAPVMILLHLMPQICNMSNQLSDSIIIIDLSAL
ncbi:uncharacterized protein EV154DRAFT_565785 [Mucor mucedo]|uniref:uncharacterized protein n=1 Tax=Mucor mucedo TaxID=29922 RepID=UPI002220C2F8|nr:uncharacterized protein EV154DRAFT_565785 [Mucor mucedo]KAI7889012.1 hypothetical protein EV154DRAFT_565785 [Mucor mucedo]